MVDKVIPFTGTTTLAVDVDTVLEAAKGQADRVIIIGRRDNDTYYFASSDGTNAESLWDIEQFKQFLLTGE